MGTSMRFSAVPASGEFFIGRRKELAEVADAFRAGVAEVNVTGAHGIGKTSFLRVFALREKQMFPDGIFLFDRYATTVPPLDSATNRVLLVLDEFTPEIDLPTHKTLQRRLTGEDAPRVLTASVQPVALSKHVHRVELGPFRPDEAIEFLDRAGIPYILAVGIVQTVGTNPRALAVAADLARDGSNTLERLRDLLRPFVAPGIVGPDGKPLDERDIRLERMIQRVTDIDDLLIDELAANPSLLFQLAPRRFEELVAELLSRQGFEVEVTPATRDGGRDIFAASNNSLGEFLYYVECKRYAADRPVTVRVIRELHGVAQAHGATAGLVVTTSHFTRGAEEFRDTIKHTMSLRDYVAVCEWLDSANRRRPL